MTLHHKEFSYSNANTQHKNKRNDRRGKSYTTDFSSATIGSNLNDNIDVNVAKAYQRLLAHQSDDGSFSYTKWENRYDWNAMTFMKRTYSDINGYFMTISFVNNLLIGPRFPQLFWLHLLSVQFTRCILIHQQMEIEIMPISRFLWMSMLVWFKDAFIGCLFIRYWACFLYKK